MIQKTNNSYFDSYSDLINEYGEPYYLNNNGTFSCINEAFWAGLYFAENEVLYEPEEKLFYKYEKKTGIYKKISDAKIKTEISKLILKASKESGLASLEKHRRNSVLNNIVSQLKGISEIREAFKKVINYVHAGNIIIRFNEHLDIDFSGYSPEFLSRNQSPIIYDPDATCNRFLGELLLRAVPEEDAVIIQKYTGLCLLGINLIQKFLILDGAGGTGKSTLSLIIQKLVGLENVTQLRTHHLAERFELYRYRNKTLITGVDVSGKFLSDKGAHLIKGLVGGDYFDAEQKGGTGSFQIQGDYCIIITSNSKLQLRLDGDVEAWRRRLLIVRYESTPPVKKIPKLDEILISEEGSGILNWALEGLRLVLKDIEQYGDIKLEQKQRQIVDALMAESDSLRHFLNDRVVKKEGCDLTVNEIIEFYAEYCPEKGWDPKPITSIQRELPSLMLELFATTRSHSIKRDGISARGYRRVGFKLVDTE